MRRIDKMQNVHMAHHIPVGFTKPAPLLILRLRRCISPPYLTICTPDPARLDRRVLIGRARP
jgi:hypothetical protein